ncbi:ATP-dependent RNA helicase HrpA [Solilutibacter tolerans]|uniref:ATP-dependent helicase HrpA n=1 Tax=Solilutibacter tolerans TaxID=1604334 RepID=A0A1N6U016_9GAMM|nr:ATP-dependent RNA helicase HrpA [Lysobacter tolerans]SIQ58831.1 ATP-dependent helicase HrpA [Lysobacter tolerans]
MPNDSTPSIDIAVQPGQAKRAIDAALTRDRGRLIGLWSKWKAKPDDEGLRDAFATKLQASITERERRAAQLPVATINADLPIAAHADVIIELIRKHQVVVLAGETGSGKTTQLPKLCLLAGRGQAGMIGCTQPRRIAARSVARRVAEELQVPMGGAVGFQVRFNDQVSDATAIKFMTDGILLAEIQNDRWLSRYDTIIIDEAHERSLNIDFLLGYLRQLLPRRPDLKVIVTSATIDTARFAEHFGDAPVVEVEGRTFPVELRYRPLEGEGEDEGARSVLDGIVAACDEITRENPLGDTLIFLPGEREIRDAHLALERRKYRSTEVVPLYARLSARDQDKVFQPGVKRRIVLATNVAETSLTVPRIRYVVDPGYARVKRYSPRQKLDRLHIEPVSQASANQRAGRCGRVADGVCIRLYSETDFGARAEFTDPEIRRAALAGVILRMLSIGLGDIETFPFLEPPDPRAVADGWQQLSELGAIDGQRKLTAVGKQMAKLPVDVKLSRMLIAAEKHGVLHEMLAIASFLGIQDPRERPADARAAADAVHAEFADAKSEFIGIWNLWDAFRIAHEDLSQSQLRKWAERHFLGFLRLREWRELHRQLKLQCEEMGWSSGRVLASSNKQGPSEKSRKPAPDSSKSDKHGPTQQTDALKEVTRVDYAKLHRALIAGLPTQVAHLGDRGVYEGPRGRRFQLFPGSALARKPPAWVLSATLLDTERVWAITNAAIEPDWVIAELPHLLARRHHDPHWSRSQGRVIGSEQISLFGLVLAPKKPVHYGALYPEESRAIFVRDGLVTGDINTRSTFLPRNLLTLQEAKEEEAKQRRAGLVVDEDWQARWYLDRLPAQIHGAQAMDAWFKRLPKAEQAALVWTRDDLLIADETDAVRFPPYLALGDARLAVRYRFEPGAVDDGMTLVVPLHLLNALDDARLSWLAPGFIQDKAAALIKSLPKVLRRNFVPAPDFARAFAQAHPEPGGDAMTSVLARFLKRLSGVEMSVADFDEADIDPHLRMNLQLQDESGKQVLAHSRDLDELRTKYGDRAQRAFASRAAKDMARSGLQSFPEDPIPVQIMGDGGIPAYPALQDDGDAASLHVHAQRNTAQRLHPAGVRRLLRIALTDKFKQARRQLPIPPKTGLLYAALDHAPSKLDALRKPLARDADQLREDLVEGAFSSLSNDERLMPIRDRGTFDSEAESIGKTLFAESMRRLQQADAILTAIAEVRARLESRLMGWASGNLDDMRAHLDSLAAPGFLRETPAEALVELPRYLKALSLRAERAQRDPQKDQARMLELKPFVDALAEADPAHVDAQALRWELEELRVATYAQELGAKGGISAKKLAARIAKMQAVD